MESLRLLLEPTPAEREVADQITTRVILVNDGDEPVTVNHRFAVSSSTGPGELTFSVTDPQDEPLPFGARVNLGRADPNDIATIAPRHFVGTTIDLVDYFDLSEPGSYRIRATYRSVPGGITRNGDTEEDDDNDLSTGVWTGTLTSDEVSIELG